MKVGIMVNVSKPGAKTAVLNLRKALESQGIGSLLEKRAADIMQEKVGYSDDELAAQSDLIVVLGGDGTMLSAVAKLDGYTKAVAGLNIGTLGFLTSCTDDESEFFAKSLISGEYWTSPRPLLKSTITFADGRSADHYALNEIVLARGQTGKLIALKATINGELLNHYRADGLIVATPTGSTAYSLSAGGPLISPDAAVFVITPICPHSLSYRSLVVNDSSVVEIIPEGQSEEPMFFTVDGRDIVPITSGGSLTISKADKTFHLLRLKDRTFYDALRQKLGWKG